MTDSTRTPVTVLGLGPMGTALAGALVDAGHPTTVWNRTAAKADPLVARGAAPAGTIADAVTASPLVLVCVIDYDAVQAVLEPVVSLLRGRTLVNLTADSPQRARDMAAWAAAHGVAYLDGSIMSPAETIGGPEAVLLVSGSQGAFGTHRAAFAGLGGTTTFVGTDPGRAAALDVALLDVFWTAMSGLVHAFALAQVQGITARELLPHALGLLKVTADVAPELAERADTGRFAYDGSSLVSNSAGMAHIIHAAQDSGLDTSVLAAAKAVADRAIAAGHGEDDFSRLVDVLVAGAAAPAAAGRH